MKKRTQVERRRHTRARAHRSARQLWAERGYAAVGTPEIAAAAGVTRGALYHQFADKGDLFAAVAEAVETDVTRRIAEQVAGVRRGRPDRRAARRLAGLARRLRGAEVRQVILLDGPVDPRAGRGCATSRFATGSG